jgi:long-chain acyl-CoA synthetase
MDNEAFDFLRALGINVKHLFGTTETQINTVHRTADVRCETVGTAIPGCAVKILEGEILLRGVASFEGYFKGRKKGGNSMNRVSADGWFHTGERGLITKENHLVRIREVGRKDG